MSEARGKGAALGKSIMVDRFFEQPVLNSPFESHAQETEGGVEFWLARDLQHLLGYSEWRNFGTTISKAKTACEVSEHEIPDHFVDVNKMVALGSGSEREIDDIMLTRYACYLIAQNGDPKKEQIVFAQPHFALQATLKAEINEEAGESLQSDTSRPFAKPANGRIAVKVINHLGDEVMKVFRV